MVPKKTGKLGIMNLMAGAAHNRAQRMGQTAAPDDLDDPVNSETPTAKKSPAASKKVAAIKMQAKKKGPLPQEDDDHNGF